MNALVTTHASLAVANYTAAELNLIKNTVAKDTNSLEFDLFMAVARKVGLDPFRKQISAIVFNKDKGDKRQLAIITTIDGLRTIAARSKRYRPDEDEPVYETDPTEKGPLNPKGLVKASVRIYIADAQREGGWKPVNGTARWEEFAPIKDEWGADETGKWRKTGAQTLDAGGNWGRMPYLMLAKCAEAQALRRAFPEDLSGLYEESEMHRAQIVEALPSELIANHETANRIERLGLAHTIMFQLFPNAPLEPIKVGSAADKLIEVIREFSLPEQVRWFRSTNTAALRELWARAQSDALGVKKELEAKEAELAKEDDRVPA